MSQEISDSNEYQQLRDQFYASKGVQQFNANLSHALSFYIFEKNYHEALGVIQLHFDLMAQRKLGSWDNKARLHEFLREVTRLLHNFLSAAKTLVDNTRRFVKSTYGEETDAFREYNAQVSQVFGTSPVHKFTIDLRDVFTHVGIPFISSVQGGSNAVGRERFTLRLEVHKMTTSRPWNPYSKGYIKNCGGKVDLELYLTSYFGLVSGFYDWLVSRTDEWGKSERDEAIEIQQRLREFEERLDRREK